MFKIGGKFLFIAILLISNNFLEISNSTHSNQFFSIFKFYIKLFY